MDPWTKMGNPVLFLSSVILGSVHIAAMATIGSSHEILCAVYLVGVATSLINHGLNSSIARWSDRLWMALGTFLDFLYVSALSSWSRTLGILLILAYTSAFAAAKLLILRTGNKKTGNLPHLFTHISATTLHVWVLWLYESTGAPPPASLAATVEWSPLSALAEAGVAFTALLSA